MGTNEDDRSDGAALTQPGAHPPQGRTAVSGSRGKITTRPSRESILQSYASQDELRARDARMRSQQAAQSYAASAAQRDAERAARQEALIAQQREQEALRAQREAERIARQQQRQQAAAAQRRTRVVPPLSSQESYDLTRSSQESYERARASRDALSESRRGRALNREVIDGRGSIDSRTFNESQQISGYSRDERDRPDPMVDTVNSRTSWRSRAGQGFDAPAEGGAMRYSRRAYANAQGRTAARTFDGGANVPQGTPAFLKVTLPIMVILFLVILYLLFF